MKNAIIFYLALFLLGFSTILLADDSKETETQKVTTVKSEKKSEKHYQHTKQEKNNTDESSVGFSKKPADGTEAVCPVTKERFKITKDTTYSEYKGKYYYFCCEDCKPQFDKEPEKYLK